MRGGLGLYAAEFLTRRLSRAGPVAEVGYFPWIDATLSANSA